MDIRRLGWAGLELTSDDTTLVIDHIESLGAMTPILARDPGPLPPPSTPVDFALVTHLHVDHTDPKALAAALKPGAPVLGPAPGLAAELDPVAYAAALAAARDGIAEHHLDFQALDPWQTTELGPFTVTALPAADGFGDPQVSWMVEADGQRLLHCGDTLFHGFWFDINARFGPVDVAAVPINGAVCNFPHRQPPSPFAAVMDPVQAAAACRMVGAKLAVPIHYEAIHAPPFYVEVDEPAEAFARECERLDIPLAVLEPGQTLQTAADAL